VCAALRAHGRWCGSGMRARGQGWFEGVLDPFAHMLGHHMAPSS
jgi:hypothetical protein